MPAEVSRWLPELLELPPQGHRDDGYLVQVYESFQRDFLTSNISWPDKRFAMKRLPEREGWPATFWHLITEGSVENDREIVYERCQKIRWPKALIDKYLEFPEPGNNFVNFWYNSRKQSSRLLISTLTFDYLVVIEDRSDYVLLWTAYPTREHTAHKLRREHDSYWALKG